MNKEESRLKSGSPSCCRRFSWIVVAGRCRFAGNVRSYCALRRSAILLRAGYFPDAGFFTQRTGMPERQSMSIMFTWLLFEKSRYW